MKKILLLFGLITMVTFYACNQGGDDDLDKEDYDKKICFDLVFPVSYVMPDGTTISGDKEEVYTALELWYKANPDADQKPELQFPVDIVDEEGTVSTLVDEAALIAAKEDCYGG